jgi:tetratricopeptide (TPR) repeat protein
MSFRRLSTQAKRLFPDHFAIRPGLRRDTSARIPAVATGLFTAFLLASCTTATPAGPGPLLVKANHDLRSGHYQESRQILNDLRRTDPEDPAVWNNLAALEFREHHFRKALSDLDHGLALDPKNSGLRLNKARLLLTMDRNHEARALLLDMENANPWPQGFRILMAIADWRTGHRESARLLFREILADHPNDPMAEAYLSKPDTGMTTSDPPGTPSVPKPKP